MALSNLDEFGGGMEEFSAASPVGCAVVTHSTVGVAQPDLFSGERHQNRRGRPRKAPTQSAWPVG